LKKGELEIPSDFAGVVWSPTDNNAGWRVLLGKASGSGLCHRLEPRDALMATRVRVRSG
jgi:hypothetical protein